jgi:hypothetical protein
MEPDEALKNPKGKMHSRYRDATGWVGRREEKQLELCDGDSGTQASEPIATTKLAAQFEIRPV